MTKEETNWIEEFEKQFVAGNNDSNFCLNTDNPLKIEDFISKLISQEKEKWVEEIKKGLLNCPKTDWGDTDEETPDSWEEGYEQCLQDTLDFVNNLLQKQ